MREGRQQERERASGACFACTVRNPSLLREGESLWPCVVCQELYCNGERGWELQELSASIGPWMPPLILLKIFRIMSVLFSSFLLFFFPVFWERDRPENEFKKLIPFVSIRKKYYGACCLFFFWNSMMRIIQKIECGARLPIPSSFRLKCTKTTSENSVWSKGYRSPPPLVWNVQKQPRIIFFSRRSSLPCKPYKAIVDIYIVFVYILFATACV